RRAWSSPHVFQRGLAFPKIISKGNVGLPGKNLRLWQPSIKSYVGVTQRLFRATDAMDDLPIHRHLGAYLKLAHLSRAWFANPSAERAGRSDRRQGGHALVTMRPCAI